MNKKLLLVAGVLTILSGNVMGAVTTDDQGTLNYTDRYSTFPTTLMDAANFNQRHIEFSTMDKTKNSDEYKGSQLTSETFQIEDHKSNEHNSLYADSNGLTLSYSERTGPNNFLIRENLELTLHKVSMNNNRVEKIAKGIESEDAVNLSQLQEVENKIKDVASGSNITVKKELDFFGRETNTSVVNLNEDLVDMNSIKFGTEDDNAKSEINQTSVSFYNDKQNEGSALTSHSLEMNTKNGSSSLDGTSLTISNGIDGNIATMGANGFATETKDGKHLEFSSDNVTVAGQQIHDVAKGIDDTDAVNVKQLKDYVAANGSVDTNTITTVTNGDNATVTGITDASGNKEFKVAVNKDLTDMNSAKFVSGDNETKVDGAEITFKSNKDQVHTEVQAGAIGVSTEKNRTVIYEDGVIIGNAAETELSTSDSSGLSVTNADGKKVEFKLNNVSVGDNQIHDVATGIADTDAVNVKQLKDYVAANGGVDTNTITTVKAGNNIEVTANGHDYTVSLNKDVVDKIDNATAGVKANADAIKSNTDAIKANTADIADNKAQIDNLVNQIGNNDTKINNMISNTRHEARRGIASASALAALHPLDYNPDHKVDVMGGVGHYRGKTAVALGAAYRPNENLMFTVGTAINGKDSSVNAGVSYKVGAKDSTYKSQASLAKDVEDLKQIVAKLQAELEEARKK